MKQVSDNRRRLLDEGIKVYSRAVVTFLNSSGTVVTTITLTPDKFRVSGNNYSETGGSAFPIGMALSKSVVLTVSNQYNEWAGYDWSNTEINLFSVIYPDGINQSYERLTREGMFYTSKVRYVQNAIEITAYDMISLSNNKFVITNAPAGQILYATPWDYFVYLCDTELADKLGVTLLPTQHLYASHLDTDRFLNSDFQMDDIAPGNAKTTLREAFGYIAQLAGGNIVARWDGTHQRQVIDIVPYSLDHTEYTLYSGMIFGDTVNTTFDGGVFGETISTTLVGGEVEDNDYVLLNQFTTAPSMEYSDVMLTGITMTYPVPSNDDRQATTKSTDVNVLELENPLLQVSPTDSTGDARVKACVDNLYNAICEKPFRPFDGSFRNNPLIEVMDNVIVTDGWGEAHNSFITEHTYNYLGTSEVSNKVPTTSQSNNTFYR